MQKQQNHQHCRSEKFRTKKAGNIMVDLTEI